jgi:hypothetical protein
MEAAVFDTVAVDLSAGAGNTLPREWLDAAVSPGSCRVYRESYDDARRRRREPHAARRSRSAIARSCSR